MSIFRIKNFLEGCWLNIQPRKLKKLAWLIKFWWNSWDNTSYDTLEILKYQLEQLLDYHENRSDYKNSEKYTNKIKIVLECIRRILEEDFGEIEPLRMYMIREKENMEMFIKYFKNIDRW